LYNTSELFRSREAQELIHDAALWREAQRKAREAEPVRAAKPMMPGTKNGAGGGGDALADAARAGDMAKYARLRAAQDRRARR